MNVSTLSSQLTMPVLVMWMMPVPRVRRTAVTKTWRGNVDSYVLRMSEARYYNDPVTQHGYFRGRETYDYVNSIRTRWNEYKAKIKD